MILLLTGASHTGKTTAAQTILEKQHINYLSIDHLKMGLIRSGQTKLTVEDDKELTDYLWPIVVEIIKTAIENQQDLVVEGCYIPFDWQKDLEAEYLSHIPYTCLIFSENYIKEHFSTIKAFANITEKRIDDSWATEELLLQDNAYYLENCEKYNLNYILIDQEYYINPLI